MGKEKNEIITMVNDIYEQCVIDYLYVIVKDAYREACSQQDVQRCPVAPNLTA